MIRALLLTSCLAVFTTSAAAEDANVTVRFPSTAIAKVMSTAERDVDYDRAKVVIGVTATGASSEEVARRLAETLTPLVATLRKAVPTDKALSSSGPTIRDRYEIVRDEQGREIYEKRKRIGSEGSYDIYVALSDLSRVADIVKIATDAGAFVYRVEFATSTSKAIYQELREEAVRKGVEQAKRQIEAAGGKPGRVLEIQDSNFREQADLGVPRGSGTETIPILPGTNYLSVMVDVWVEILKPSLPTPKRSTR
jgi:uncharacterized protein YggE